MKDGSFKWLFDPFKALDQTAVDTATWYTDGSMLMGRWTALRCTGFGVVVVAEDGQLLGYGFGTPPTRIATAAAAELWAIDFVLSCNPRPPKIKTDCMSILTAARSGSESATSASRPLARLWRSIQDSLDGDIFTLIDQDLLSWILAHLSIKAVGERRLPDGSRLSMIDWRANRLVDVLAKFGASKFCPSEDVQTILKSATVLAKHMAAQLGEVTHVANHFEIEETMSDGKVVKKI